MEKYKGKTVPPIADENGALQTAHCQIAVKCIDNCRDCLFDGSNFVLFTEWLKREEKEVTDESL